MNSFVYLTFGNISGGVLGRSYFATTCSREVMDRSCICEYFTNDIISGLVRDEILLFVSRFGKLNPEQKVKMFQNLRDIISGRL